MVAQLVDPLYTEALYIVVVSFCTRRHIRFLPSNRVGSNFDACALWLKSKSAFAVFILFVWCNPSFTCIDGIPSNLSIYMLNGRTIYIQ